MKSTSCRSPGCGTRRLRWLAYASLTAWILLTLMPVVTLAMSAVGQRADADSSRLAVSTTTGLAASSLQASLASNQAIAATHLSFAALLAQLRRSSPMTGSGSPRRSRRGCRGQLARSDRPMTRMPTAEDGVDEALVSCAVCDDPRTRCASSRSERRRRSSRTGGKRRQPRHPLDRARRTVSECAGVRPGSRAAPRLVRIGGLAMLGGAVFTAAASVIAFV